MTPAEIMDHPLRETLRQIRDARNWEQVLAADPESNSAWLLERIFRFGDLVIQRLDGTPVFLVSSTGLSSINSAMQSALSGLSNFRSSLSEAALNEANQAVDTAMQSLWAIPSTVVGEAQTAMAEAASTYFAHGQKAIAFVNEKAKETAGTIAGLRESLAGLEKAAVTVGETLASQKAEATAVNAEVKRDFAKTDQEYREKFGALIDEQRTAHTAAVGELKTTAVQALEDLESKRKEAAKIVQIVGNIGVTGNYQKIAESEGNQADIWRRISFGVLVAAAGFGAYTLLEFSKDELRWVTAVLRMLFAFVIASIALYTARESARHRTNADSARRKELELASLGPFIESLPSAQQEEIRKSLTDRYFGGEVQPHTVDPVVSGKDVVSVLEKSVDGLRQVGTEMAKGMGRK